jgi:2-keto-4-pentenoate hydratase/2-oxohepta-3-ene-1,7-dioic acid hydratase in catechol pathway
MKLCRFDDDRLGLVTGDQIVDVTVAIECLPPVKWPYAFSDPLIANWTALRPAIEKAASSGCTIPVSSAVLRSPIANPSKVVGIARNRKNLETEQLNFSPTMNRRTDGDPIDMFIKASSAVAGAGDGVRLRFSERRTDPEVELTVVIGRTAVDIPKEQAMEHIFGYCIGLDMTAREGKENISTRKSFDTYALLGPWIVTKDEVPDPGNLGSVLLVNGKQAQSGNTRDLAFDVPTVVSALSKYFTLYPGDVIMMGTPVGFEPVVDGDIMDIEFERIGRMTVKVIAHS